MQIYQTDSDKLEVVLWICLRQKTQMIFLSILFLESEMKTPGFAATPIESYSARQMFDFPLRVWFISPTVVNCKWFAVKIINI